MHNERIEATYKNDGQNYYGRLTYEKEKPEIVLNPLLKKMLRSHVDFKPEPQIEMYEDLDYITIPRNQGKSTFVRDLIKSFGIFLRRK